MMWRMRYSSGMTSDTPPWSPTKERTSRPDAEKALINAVITLVDTTPIADITVHQLAHEAGVNFGYINRYFESRLNLFAAATDELADRGIAFLKTIVVTQPIFQRQGTKDLSAADLQKSRDSIIPIGVKRLQIVQFLVASGVPAERFVNKSQEVLAAAIAITTAAGLDPQIARARVVHGIAMMWGAATLSPILGLTPQELNDSYALFFADVTSNKE
jgi:AcrR family transcriptional regulator